MNDLYRDGDDFDRHIQRYVHEIGPSTDISFIILMTLF